MNTILCMTVAILLIGKGGYAGDASKEKLVASKAVANEKPIKFGAPIGSHQSAAFDDLLAQPSRYLKSTIVTEGKVAKVCEKKGCWMEVHGERHRTRVTFKDYGFFVPANLLNKSVRLQGELIEKTMSVKEQKHYLEDEGKSKAEIAAVTEPKQVFEFVAEGVELVQ